MKKPQGLRLFEVLLATSAVLLLGVSACKENRTECEAPRTACGAACVHVERDPQNCGGCRQRCDADRYCSEGRCVPLCGVEETTCGEGAEARCVSLRTDPANCGACGVACGAGQRCASGACECVEAGLSPCGQECRSLADDSANCGACGVSCGGDLGCVDGLCGCGQASLTNCGGACKDLVWDPANCGACGAACPPEQECGMSWCRCIEAGLTACGESCVDLKRDPENCGGCDAACTGSCGSGTCRCDGLEWMAAEYLLPEEGHLLRVAELSREGSSDVLVLGSTAIHLLERTGEGFAEPRVVAYESASEARFGDVDGDGRIDVLARVKGGIRVLYNRLPRGFVSGALIEVQLARTFGAGAGDVDADGSPEVVLASVDGLLAVRPGDQNQRSLLLKKSNLELRHVVDLDGDRRADFVVDGLRVLWNRPERIVEEQVFDSAPSDVVIADVGADGRLDLVVSERDRGLHVVRQVRDDGMPRFVRQGRAEGDLTSITVVTESPRGGVVLLARSGDLLLMYDVDALGRVAARADSWRSPGNRSALAPGETGESTQAVVLLDSYSRRIGTRPALFEPAKASWRPLPGEGRALAEADFDGDGKRDIVVLTDDLVDGRHRATLVLFPGLEGGGVGDGRVAYTTAGNHRWSTIIPVLRAGGGHDLASSTFGFLRWVDGGFARIWPGAGGTASSDLDGDGHGDLVAGSQLWWGRGDGWFDYQYLPHCGGQVVLADLDQNGFEDVVSLGGGKPCVQYNEGGRKFSLVDAEPVSSRSAMSELVVGDVTGDGAPEIVVLMVNSVVVFSADRGRELREVSRQRLGLTDSSVRATVGDLDGDGLIDLLKRPFSGDLGWVVFSRGGRFSAKVDFPNLSRVANLAFDFDGDGKQEVVALGDAQMAILEAPVCP